MNRDRMRRCIARSRLTAAATVAEVEAMQADGEPLVQRELGELLGGLRPSGPRPSCSPSASSRASSTASSAGSPAAPVGGTTLRWHAPESSRSSCTAGSSGEWGMPGCELPVPLRSVVKHLSCRRLVNSGAVALRRRCGAGNSSYWRRYCAPVARLRAPRPWLGVHPDHACRGHNF